MQINNNRTDQWKSDTIESVDFYNKWFMQFAPIAFRSAREGVANKVRKAIKATSDLTKITAECIMNDPAILGTLRMATVPPLAIDRLAGLSNTSRSLIKRLESGSLSRQLTVSETESQIAGIVSIIKEMLDEDIMPWIPLETKPKPSDLNRCVYIIADRLSGSLADPIIRNEQEKRQLAAISSFLDAKGYKHVRSNGLLNFKDMPRGSYTFHQNVPVELANKKEVNVPVDVAIASKDDPCGELPLLIECKSAGDFTNTNKRRKEEAAKMAQLKATYGEAVRYVLFLCGYFDTSYLGYEAAEGIDWVWEHRISDLNKLGL